MPTTVTLRQLNRSLLARQCLLTRERSDAKSLIAQLVALQSQIPNPPYIGLWTRLQGFEKQRLTALLDSREVVRAPLLRSTLHLLTAEDHQQFQADIQPALARGLRAFFGKRARSLNIERLIASAKPFIEAEQPAIGTLRAQLQALEPEQDKEAMAYAVRSYLPLVQVPPSGTWGVGTRATYTTAEAWLGALPGPPAGLEALFRRYLAAFGPASVMDFQTWSGMTSLKSKLAPALKTLTTYADEQGSALYDLPGQPLTSAAAPAPIRFLPEYDNILIAHRDRRRILPEAHHKKVFVSAGRVLGSVLIDGFVGAIWRAKRQKGRATLTISHFAPLADETLAAIESEGEALLRFIEEDADSYDLKIAEYA